MAGSDFRGRATGEKKFETNGVAEYAGIVAGMLPELAEHIGCDPDEIVRAIEDEDSGVQPLTDVTAPDGSRRAISFIEDEYEKLKDEVE